MLFDPQPYGKDVAQLLAMDGNGTRPMPLTPSGSVSPEARNWLLGRNAAGLFRQARAPEAAMSGLYLYFGCVDEAHNIAQDVSSADGSYWHGIVHRQEPDPDNAAYWFRRVGQHPVFPAVREAAKKFAFDWDPFGFIDFCEQARRQPESDSERLAMAVQLAEWQILFDWCAKPQPQR